ncbi:putative zinc finger/helix-turn-helix YgiT family protein [Trichococcus patagoniensis]|uniref:Putative zinc finger/helix-turn-helix YgiT family protein n=1 Tax=Trichococcus patagoniensis TaxID=382641 RepID=A0A2T5IQ58_9LACT|nr:type II TA system antitoxin MqsA family protein [Trichococcus patagoniensis]PTQ85949.1 putative zinc finger/helix-turn-helix YgiT family protein [Trichococcus patagoniensis]
MNKEYLIEKVKMDCPVCGEIHNVEKRKRMTQGIVKGEVVDFEEVFFLCPITGEEENEFVSARVMDENLLRARDAYRIGRGLLTSNEIAEIRNFYELTQSEFSNLLGWGDVTVTRYESKTIQDETYDNLMRMTGENPFFALQSLEKHEARFTEEKYHKIRNKIIKRVEESGTQYLKIQEINSIYVNYEDESDYNGYRALNLEKVANVVGYFANFVNNLYKVKLMKLLWYADVVNFKRFGKSMTGLVYKHMPYGALPLAYDEIIHLPTVTVEEEMLNDYISYKILPNSEVNISSFTIEELSVLEMISKKFNNYRSKDIVDYMHKEKAYKETEPYKLISFELAKELNELT